MSTPALPFTPRAYGRGLKLQPRPSDTRTLKRALTQPLTLLAGVPRARRRQVFRDHPVAGPEPARRGKDGADRRRREAPGGAALRGLVGRGAPAGQARREAKEERVKPGAGASQLRGDRRDGAASPVCGQASQGTSFLLSVYCTLICSWIPLCVPTFESSFIVKHGAHQVEVLTQLFAACWKRSARRSGERVNSWGSVFVQRRVIVF